VLYFNHLNIERWLKSPLLKSQIREVRRMVKKTMVKAIAPVAKTAAQRSTGWICWGFLNQPKLPKKLMDTVK